MSPEEFQAASNVSRETMDRLKLYVALLEKWNRRINLVAKDSLADLWRRHVLDSAQLLPLLPPGPAGRPRQLVDLGSGAGFPGLVLAILGAGETHLIESDGRKAAFLREAGRETGTAVTIHNHRIEAVAPFPVEVVTARACAPLPRLLGYAAPFLAAPGAAPGGKTSGIGLFLKGRNVDQELTEARERWNMQIERLPSRTDPAAVILRLSLPQMEES